MSPLRRIPPSPVTLTNSGRTNPIPHARFSRCCLFVPYALTGVISSSLSVQVPGKGKYD